MSTESVQIKGEEYEIKCILSECAGAPDWPKVASSLCLEQL